MHKVSKFISFGLAGLIFLSSATFAYADLCPTGNFAPLCSLKLNNASTITGSVVTVLLMFAVIVSLIFLIVGGIRWTMSSGDKAKLDTAKATITGAITGLIVAFSAYFILNVITYLFTKSTFLNFTIPTIVP